MAIRLCRRFGLGLLSLGVSIQTDLLQLLSCKAITPALALGVEVCFRVQLSATVASS